MFLYSFWNFNYIFFWLNKQVISNFNTNFFFNFRRFFFHLPELLYLLTSLKINEFNNFWHIPIPRAHPLGVVEVMSSILGQICVIVRDIEILPAAALSNDIDSMSMGGMYWPKPAATHYFSKLGLPDKGHAIKELVVCNSFVSRDFGPAKSSSPMLLKNIPWGYESYPCPWRDWKNEICKNVEILNIPCSIPVSLQGLN